MTDTAMADKLAEVEVRQREGLETTPRTRLIGEVIADLEPQIIKALPIKKNAERFLRLALTEIRTVPHLVECSQASVVAGVMRAAQLGLEIGGDRGQVWLIPRWNKDLRCYEATWQLGYKGVIDIAGRNGIKVSVKEIHANDDFEHEDTDRGPKLRHTWTLGEDRGPVVGLWARARFADNSEPEVLVMSLGEVDQVGEQFGPRNKAGHLVGPWSKPESKPGMRRKTVVRRVLNYVPLAVEVEDALRADEGVALQVDNEAQRQPIPLAGSGDAALAPVASVTTPDPAEGPSDDVVDIGIVEDDEGSPSLDPMPEAHVDAMAAATAAADEALVSDEEKAAGPRTKATLLLFKLDESRLPEWQTVSRKWKLPADMSHWSDDQVATVIDWLENPPEAEAP